MPKLIITIAKGGKTTLNVDGERGTACKGLTEAIALKMGLTKLNETLKPEFYETTVENRLKT